jgi:hypothetical protein
MAVKRKLKKGDTITTIYGDTATITAMGSHDEELTRLDKAIYIGDYADGNPCFNHFITTGELYEILENTNRKVR